MRVTQLQLRIKRRDKTQRRLIAPSAISHRNLVWQLGINADSGFLAGSHIEFGVARTSREGQLGSSLTEPTLPVEKPTKVPASPREASL
jgi:hypothetical protein